MQGKDKFTVDNLACYLIFVILLGILAIWFYILFAFSDIPNKNTYVANGTVSAIVTDGATTYIGGAFTLVGPNTGQGVPIATSTGSPVATYPKVKGIVYVCIPDGSGGWYIGGDFTAVGGAGTGWPV